MTHISTQQRVKPFGSTKATHTCEQLIPEACKTRTGMKTAREPVRCTRHRADATKDECRCGGCKWKFYTTCRTPSASQRTTTSASWWRPAATTTSAEALQLGRSSSGCTSSITSASTNRGLHVRITRRPSQWRVAFHGTKPTTRWSQPGTSSWAGCHSQWAPPAGSCNEAAISSSFGLAVDNVLQMELVTADGALRIANPCQEVDLFFALRGGGGETFGVVTSVTYKLH